MSLTADEARLIADSLLEAGKAIDEYLDNNFNNISRPEYEFLNESFKTLLRVSTFATTMAVGLSIDALKDPATDMNKVIEQTKEKIKKLKNAGRVIRFVAGLADLAAGIMGKDPSAIAGSVKSLRKLLKA